MALEMGTQRTAASYTRTTTAAAAAASSMWGGAAKVEIDLPVTYCLKSVGWFHSLNTSNYVFGFTRASLKKFNLHHYIKAWKNSWAAAGWKPVAG